MRIQLTPDNGQPTEAGVPDSVLTYLRGQLGREPTAEDLVKLMMTAISIKPARHIPIGLVGNDGT